MTPYYQIPRNTLIWLFGSQLVVLAPHLTRTPFWVTALLLLCMLWRVQVFRGVWNYPGKLLKVVLLLGSVAGLIITFPSFFDLAALVSVLFVGYGLKLLEMYYKRDALVLLYLSFFLVMTSFLFEQPLLLALYNIFTVMVILTTLRGLYQESGYRHPWRSFRRSSALVLQALPLMVLMFIALPRFPSFWNIPLNKSSPKTGMSDSMSPGDFSRLIQSSDPVMRISFQAEVPNRRDMYWRGLVFSDFDGRHWKPLEFQQQPAPNTVSSTTDNHVQPSRGTKAQLESTAALSERSQHPEPLLGIQLGDHHWDYTIIQEPTQQPWLFSLAPALPLTQGILLTSDFLLLKDSPVNERFRYNVVTYPDNILNRTLYDDEREIETLLPPKVDPQSRALAVQWRQEATSDEDYIQRVLQFYHQQFFYTLRPPKLGSNSNDDFLFNTKKGYCEHFAGSFVFLMRAAGIPARVVVGYQGGEWNPYENYLLIKQYDAHAWAEVWLAGKGWVRYDPTFAVAPQRILDGFRETFEQRGENNLPRLSLDRYHNIALLNVLRLQIDRLNYNWVRWVLSYDSTRQIELMTSLFGEFSMARIAGIFVFASVLLLVLMYGFLLWQERDRTPDPVLRAYRRLCRRLARRGQKPRAGETPVQFLQRLAREQPQHYAHLSTAAVALQRYWYQSTANDAEASQLCKQLHV